MNQPNRLQVKSQH